MPDIKEALSIEQIKSKIGLMLNPTDGFGNRINSDYAYIRYDNGMYPDCCIVERGGKFVKVPWSLNADGTEVVLGKAVEVEMDWKPIKKTAKESFTDDNSGDTTDSQGWAEMVGSILEASRGTSTDEYPVVLVREGDTVDGRRKYTKESVRDVVRHVNKGGIKMHIDHSTADEDKKRPERSVKTWAATARNAKEATGADGMLEARASAHIHDRWLRENLQDDVFRQHVGISIHAFGKMKQKSKGPTIVESVLRLRSADFVTQGNAGGRVTELFESRREDLEMLETLTLNELRESRPDLVEELLKADKGGDNDLNKDELKEAFAEAVKPLADRMDALESKVTQVNTGAKLAELVEAEKLPVWAGKRIIDVLTPNKYESEEAMATAVKESAKMEREYIKNFGGPTVTDNGSDEQKDTTGQVKESLKAQAADMFGAI